MKSYKSWYNRKLYSEFVGPSGQIDPQGTTPVAATPMLTEPMEQPEEENIGSAGQLVKRLTQILSNMPTNKIIQVQSVINNDIQGILQTKSSSAEKRGVLSGFNAFRQARTNLGQQPQIGA